MEENKKRPKYKKYPILDTVEFLKCHTDWEKFARDKHIPVFEDLINGDSIDSVCTKYGIKKNNIYDYSASLRYRYDNKITTCNKRSHTESETVTKLRKMLELVTEDELKEKVLLKGRELDYILKFKQGKTIAEVASEEHVVFSAVCIALFGNANRIGAAGRLYNYLKENGKEVE